MLCNSMLCYIHYSNILIINVFLCETIFEKHGCKSLFQSYAEKSDFLFFTCKRNEGVARGSRRGHRDLGPKINKIPSARLYWENRVSNA